MTRVLVSLMSVFVLMVACNCARPNASTAADASSAPKSNAAPTTRGGADEWTHWMRSLLQPNMSASALTAQIGPGTAGTHGSYMYLGPEGQSVCIQLDERRVTVIHAWITTTDGTSEKLF
jgi:hypothetical protein